MYCPHLCNAHFRVAHVSLLAAADVMWPGSASSAVACSRMHAEQEWQLHSHVNQLVNYLQGYMATLHSECGFLPCLDTFCKAFLGLQTAPR